MQPSSVRDMLLALALGEIKLVFSLRSVLTFGGKVASSSRSLGISRGVED